eukprot:PhF_6_TR42829/c0_g1_i2/m.64854
MFRTCVCFSSDFFQQSAKQVITHHPHHHPLPPMSLSRTQATSSPATLSPLRPHRRPRSTTPSNSSQQLSTATSPYPSSPSSNKSPAAQSSVWESQLKVTKHEATMLEMAHHELTIRLQLLYHKLHTA